MQQASLKREEVHAQLYEGGSRYSGLPAWIGSLLFHMVAIVVVALGLFLRPVPPGQADVREVSAAIVLKKIDAAGEYYEGEADQPQMAESAAAGAEISQAEALPSESEFSADVSSALPEASFGAQFGDPGEGAGGGNADLSVGGGGPGTRNIEGGKARTGVFGVESEGYSFVYVFDCSASMSAPAGRPLAAAKQQLLASLEALDKSHQFQIIFYNREPYLLNLTGVEGRLVFGEEKNKQQARKFVASIDAQLNTNHEPALMMAIRMRPDVIFFLTDADDPVLTDEQLRRMARLNAGGAVINTIEFGTGAPPARPNFLMRLAHEHGGQYQYVNVRQLP